MKTIIVVALFLALSASGFAQEQEIEMALPVVSHELQQDIGSSYAMSGTSTTQRITVQRVNTKAFWRDGDQAVIDNYLAQYKAKLSKDNWLCLKDALPQMVGAGIIDARRQDGCLVLNQRPVHYIALWQTYCGVTTGTDWYVRVPVPPQIHAFTPFGSQGPLVLAEIPLCMETPCAPVVCKPVGALQFRSSEQYQESPIGGIYQMPDDCPQNENCGPGQPPAEPS